MIAFSSYRRGVNRAQLLRRIRAQYRLRASSIVISTGAWGTEPLQVVNYAGHLFENGDLHKRIPAKAFECVFVVFDRDDHRTFFEALQLAEGLNGKLKNDSKQSIAFQAVASIPSFELWLLLHFEDIQAALHRDEVLKRLRTHIPGYEKGALNVFDTTKDLLDTAIPRANALSEKYSVYSDPEPFTGIGTLVRLMVDLPN